MKKQSFKNLANNLLVITDNLITQRNLLSEKLEKAENQNFELRCLFEKTKSKKEMLEVLLQFVDDTLAVDFYKTLLECSITPDKTVNADFFNHLKLMFNQFEQLKSTVAKYTNKKV